MVVSKVKTGLTALWVALIVIGMGQSIADAAHLLPASPQDPPRLLATDTAEKEKPNRVDREDDSLPSGALFRFGSVKMRHLDGICNSALSADGKFLATASPRCVCVWDLNTEKRLMALPLRGRMAFLDSRYRIFARRELPWLCPQ